MTRTKIVIGKVVVTFTACCAFASVAVVVWIMGTIIWGGHSHLTWAFLTQAPSGGMTEGGIYPAIIGTFMLVVIMSLVGVPVGTITAIYLSEYTSRGSKVAQFIRFAVNTLAGIPAIVFGLFGLGFFVQFTGGTLDKIFSPGTLHWAQPNILWASLTMALLTLPVVIVSVEEAIKTVPRDLREASLALGVTKWQTIWRVVLPNSVGGILTGAILAVSRGAGEVAPILFTGAAYFLPNLPTHVTDQFMELGYHLYIMTTQSTDVEKTLGIQYATTLVLLLLTFTLNFSAIFMRYRLRKRRMFA
ncbi:MAG: phosphate ABC transporter permease PstA [Fibrobacteria bacterium]